MKDPNFFICKECGVIIEEICGGKSDFKCDDIPLKLLDPATAEGAAEKHLPVVTVDGNKVTVNVGSISHPMSEEHSIEWIYLKTEKGSQRKVLKPNEKPIAEFLITDDDKPIAAYAYCNLHGFWKTNI